MHASYESPCRSSAKHHLLGACLSLMVPFRSMLLTLQSGLESLAPRAHRIPVYSKVFPHSHMPLSHLTRLGRQQMLQGPQHQLDPTPPPPSTDQLRCTPRGLQAQQREAVLPRFVDDHHRYRPLGGAGGPQTHGAYARLPGVLPPRPRLTLDEVLAFDLPPIGSGKGIGRFPLHQQGALVLTAHMLQKL